ncbi:MAG: methyltransferase [Caldilineaceae bacterium]|nr:methyltransferase [Caldilineaceae bacterium]
MTLQTLALFPELSTAYQTIDTVSELVAVAVGLGAEQVTGWSADEKRLTASLPLPSAAFVNAIKSQILAGADPLGDIYCQLRSPAERRPHGATYTPAQFVEAMTAWAAEQVTPQRVVDPGCGSGRFSVAAGKRFPHATIIAIETDPIAAILARANLAVHELASRATVMLIDYRDVALEPIDGPTLFIGNPPYVRHHDIVPARKEWLVSAAKSLGLHASQLAGLHVHFFLQTALLARPGDLGIFITSSEWLDVNYGELVRKLLTHPLSALTLQIIDPKLQPFPDTATTAVITGFAGSPVTAQVTVRQVEHLEDLGALSRGSLIPRHQLTGAQRWSVLSQPRAARPAGFVELGELCRVHRGQVTGANKVWVTRAGHVDLPDEVLFSTITRAQELFQSGGILHEVHHLKLVIDLPATFEHFTAPDQQRIQRFLRLAVTRGADQGYIAQHRKPWWSVRLHAPAPILATYMARRPPLFVYNAAQARHINIAHGLYPRDALPDDVLRTLAKFLSRSASLDGGRTYAGGLTKFEPREMERLLIPHPDVLAQPDAVEELLL